MTGIPQGASPGDDWEPTPTRGACEVCDKPLPYAGMGRPRRFCSEQCAQAHKLDLKPMAGKCNAKCRDGHLCGNDAGKETGHLGVGRCWLHGGRSPRAEAAGQRELQRRDAVQAVVVFGLPVDIDPHEALRDELGRAHGAVLWLQDQVRRLEGDNVVWGTVEHREGVGPEGPVSITTLKAAPSVWVQLYQEERRHYLAVAAACVKAGVEERMVRVAEEQGRQLADALHGILGELGVADHPQAGAVVRRHLALLAGEPVDADR